MAGAASIMCSYSKSTTSHVVSVSDVLRDLINGTYACENDKVMNGIVKAEYGFRGCKWILCSHVSASLKIYTLRYHV